MIQQTNPNARIIWRLHSPVAFISCDYRIFANALRASDFEHENMNEWVPRFNKIISQVARVFHDPILDWDLFSRTCAKYFQGNGEVNSKSNTNSKSKVSKVSNSAGTGLGSGLGSGLGPIPIKNDYIHFNAGGIPRYTNLYIQHIIEQYEYQ